jgi:hypothetical protein
MSQHPNRPSPPAKTYTTKAPVRGTRLTCRRCNRIHAYPQAGGPPVRCECGWWYTNHGGMIEESFKPRLGV